MKKINKILLTTTLLCLTFVGTLSASELQKDKKPFYVNTLGVEMTEEEYNNLLKGFNHDTIDSMPLETYNQFKDITTLTKREEVKYIKSDIEYDLFGNVISKHDEEITEEEYNRPAVQRANSGSSGNSRHETSHKIITISYTNASVSSSGVAVTVTNQWKETPSVKSYDVIGIRFERNLSFLKKSGIFFGYQKYTNSNGQQTINYNYDDDNWKLPFCPAGACNAPGIGLSQNLVNDGTNFSNSITLITSGISWPFTFYGAYEHATSNVSLSDSKNYSINSAGKGSVFDFASSVVNKYDNTQGVQITATLPF